ncbi:hypothetical protein CK505_13745 [Kocuria sp. WN036]|nr:hypothetical protein CK505_13745 [Kocuria sp. WN036]
MRRVINLTAVAPTLSLELQPFVRRNTSIDVIPNGLNLGAGGHDSPRYKVNNCSRPSFAVVANGFDRRKNSGAALHAFRKVREKLPSSVLHMFGQGHEPGGKAFAWAAKRGLIENVQFHGVHSHASLQSFINSEVDIMVHPSRWEACSLAILESRSLGVPVIGAKHAGGVGFTLDAGLSGDLVAQRPGAYANAMLNLVTDSGAYMRKAKQAREGLTPTFDMAIVTQLYIDRLQKILEVR